MLTLHGKYTVSPISASIATTGTEKKKAIFVNQINGGIYQKWIELDDKTELITMACVAY